MSRFLVKVKYLMKTEFLVLDECTVDELYLNGRQLPFNLTVVCPVSAVEAEL